MRTFSHVGIPTTVIHEGEQHNKNGGFYVTDFSKSSSKVEWLRCEDHCGLPALLQKTAHVAFVVEDLEKALEGAELLLKPMMASDELKIAFIVEDGAPVELMQYLN